MTSRTSTLPLVLLAAFAAGAQMPAHAATASTLRIAASDSNGQPFVLHDARGQLVGGLARDVIDPLAGALGLRVEYLNLPRARVEAWLREAFEREHLRR